MCIDIMNVTETKYILSVLYNIEIEFWKSNSIMSIQLNHWGFWLDELHCNVNKYNSNYVIIIIVIILILIALRPFLSRLTSSRPRYPIVHESSVSSIPVSPCSLPSLTHTERPTHSITDVDGNDNGRSVTRPAEAAVLLWQTTLTRTMTMTTTTTFLSSSPFSFFSSASYFSPHPLRPLRPLHYPYHVHRHQQE